LFCSAQKDASKLLLEDSAAVVRGCEPNGRITKWLVAVPSHNWNAESIWWSTKKYSDG